MLLHISKSVRTWRKKRQYTNQSKKKKFDESDSVLSKTAIVPESRERNVHISNESSRGWSLREANV